MLRTVSIATGVIVLGLVTLVVSVSTRRPGKEEGVAVAAAEPAAGGREAFARTAMRVPGWRAPEVVDGRLSHLEGDVSGAGNDKEALDGLTVAADDGRRRYEARIEEASPGAFALHLPAGVFTVTAQVGGLVAVREGIQTVAGRTQRLTLDLQPGARVQGVTRAPDGLSTTDYEVQIDVRSAGSAAPLQRLSVSAGEPFEIDGLVPGRVYDLTFEGRAIRTERLPGVQAGTSGLTVTLERAARLRGSVGRGPGGACPVEVVEVIVDEVQEPFALPVDAACGFRLDHLPAGREIAVNASQNGWHLSARVRVPKSGDPEPVCLNPPCPPLGPDLRATLVATLVGAPDDRPPRFALATSGAGCGGSGTGCEIDDLPAGVPIDVESSAAGCEQTSWSITLHPGRNEVPVTCRPVLQIEGTIRQADGSPPPVGIQLRCAGPSPSPDDGSPLRRIGSYAFSAECPASTTSVELRPRNQRSWQSAPITTPTRGHALVNVVLR